MNIGEAARAAGLSAKMVRHYESIGLLPPPRRTVAGYRVYGETDVQRLRFIRQARTLGFGLHTSKELLSLWQDGARASREVKALAAAHIAELEARRAELDAMLAMLRPLLHDCAGDEGPDCTILDSLAGKPDG